VVHSIIVFIVRGKTMVRDEQVVNGLGVALILGALISPTGCSTAGEAIGVEQLIEEMVDLENLAQRPEPFFKHAMASSYSCESHKGGDACFDGEKRCVRFRGRGEHIRGRDTGTEFATVAREPVRVGLYFSHQAVTSHKGGFS
jgi:hypothetical protein